MRHHTGLSNSFWIYAVKAKLHTVTLIKHADYKTPKELWSGNSIPCERIEIDTVNSGAIE